MPSFFPSFLASVQEWQARRRALSALSAMDDRSLADIGLSRGDIAFVVKGGAPYRPCAASRTPASPANSLTSRAA
jgi:uncharacterized protein YjiS (DUF1127 family)